MTKRQVEPEPRPIAKWLKLHGSDSYGYVDFCCECPFCGKREIHSLPVSELDNIDDHLYDIPRCYHCGKDADGNAELDLHREGDCGYYGDGDFVWNGSWKGEKDVLVHRPFDFDRTGWYGEDRIPYDRPDIKLEVYAWTSGGGWIELEDGTSRRKSRRIKAYSATLKFTSWWHHSIQVVKSKRVKTLKQLHAEIAALDLTPYFPEMLRAFYNKHNIRCVWKLEDNRWAPFMTSYGEIDGFSLPYGNYLVWEPRYGRHSKLERANWCVSGGSLRPEDNLPDPPTPWHVDAVESVIIPTHTPEVTKALDSA